MSLAHILLFSAFTGISSALAVVAGSSLGMGFTSIEFFSNYVDANVQTLIVLISSLFTIFFIFRLAKFFREVYEHKLAGMATALLGFFGSFMVVLSQENSHVFVLGIGFWMFAAFMVVFFRNKSD